MPEQTELLTGLGMALREVRARERVSQEELSLRTGVHRNYIGGVERAERNPSISTVVALAEGLGMRTSELLRLAEGEQRPVHPEL